MTLGSSEDRRRARSRLAGAGRSGPRDVRRDPEGRGPSSVGPGLDRTGVGHGVAADASASLEAWTLASRDLMTSRSGSRIGASRPAGSRRAGGALRPPAGSRRRPRLAGSSRVRVGRDDGDRPENLAQLQRRGPLPGPVVLRQGPGQRLGGRGRRGRRQGAGDGQVPGPAAAPRQQAARLVHLPVLHADGRAVQAPLGDGAGGRRAEPAPGRRRCVP